MPSLFDPTRAVRFDLPNGSIYAPRELGGVEQAGPHESSDARLLLVPASAIDEVVRHGGAAAGNAIGLLIGAACGSRAAARLGGAAALGSSPLDDVIAHLGGELSLAGIGALAMESWGRAMVMVVARAALKDDALVAAVVEGALRSATGRDLSCAPLSRECGREGDTVRVLVASRGTAERARRWLAEGVAWGEVLTRLQSSAGAA